MKFYAARLFSALVCFVCVLACKSIPHSGADKASELQSIRFAEKYHLKLDGDNVQVCGASGDKTTSLKRLKSKTSEAVETRWKIIKSLFDEEKEDFVKVQNKIKKESETASKNRIAALKEVLEESKVQLKNLRDRGSSLRLNYEKAWARLETKLESNRCTALIEDPYVVSDLDFNLSLIGSIIETVETKIDTTAQARFEKQGAIYTALQKTDSFPVIEFASYLGGRRENSAVLAFSDGQILPFEKLKANEKVCLYYGYEREVAKPQYKKVERTLVPESFWAVEVLSGSSNVHIILSNSIGSEHFKYKANEAPSGIGAKTMGVLDCGFVEGIEKKGFFKDKAREVMLKERKEYPDLHFSYHDLQDIFGELAKIRMGSFKELLPLQPAYDAIVSATFQNEYYSQDKPYYLDYQEKENVISEESFKFPLSFFYMSGLQTLPFLSDSYEQIKRNFGNDEEE